MKGRRVRRTAAGRPFLLAGAAVVLCCGAVLPRERPARAREGGSVMSGPAASAGGPTIAPARAYDLAGNMTKVPRPGAEDANHFTCTYDAWNRLVKVQNDDASATIAEYRYDGLNRRIAKLLPNGQNWKRTDFFYNEAWQVLEERYNDSQADSNAVATATKAKYVWDIRYIDAPVVRWWDQSGDGDFDEPNEVLYYCSDFNMNVTALVDPDGNVVERYQYDPYGKVTVTDGAWNVRSSGSAYANEVLYCGYRYDPETGLNHVRFRVHHPSMGWLQTDPSADADFFNRREYVASAPTGHSDPLGLQKATPASAPLESPKFEILQALPLDYSVEYATKTLSLKDIRAKAKKAIEEKFGTNSFANGNGQWAYEKQILVPKLDDFFLSGDDWAGTSGFILGWDPKGKAGPDKCTCDLSGTRFRFMGYYVVKKDLGHDVIYYGVKNDPNSSFSIEVRDTKTHEKWHPEGVPESVYTEMDLKGWTTKLRFVGYTGAVEARVKELKERRLVYINIGMEERNGEYVKIGQVSDKWCQDKIAEWFKDYLIGAEAVQKILEAGSYHEEDKNGELWFKGLKRVETRTRN